MKKIILYAAIACSISVSAQNNTAYNLIEGSKAFVELIRVFKTPKASINGLSYTTKISSDSCAIKGTGDLCIKNSTERPLTISLFKRNGNGYESEVLTLLVLPKKKEWLYEIEAGIYKLKSETEEEGEKKIFREGEIRVKACNNPVHDIKDN